MCFKVFVAELCNVLHARCMSSCEFCVVGRPFAFMTELGKTAVSTSFCASLASDGVSICQLVSEAAADQTRPPASRRRSAPSPVIPKRARCANSDLDRLEQSLERLESENILKLYWKYIEKRWKHGKQKAVGKNRKRRSPVWPLLRAAETLCLITAANIQISITFPWDKLLYGFLWNTQVWRMYPLVMTNVANWKDPPCY